MITISLDEYKKYLVNNYRYEYDNTKYEISKRKNILENKYKNDFLENIILGTYNFVNKILEMSSNNYPGYIKVLLKNEPAITYINLNLTGGYMSDIVVNDSDNNFYSINLLKTIFGPLFQIEPCKIELTEEVNGDDDFSVISEIPSYYLYIQCKKEIIDNVRNHFSENKSPIKVLKI